MNRSNLDMCNEKMKRKKILEECSSDEDDDIWNYKSVKKHRKSAENKTRPRNSLPHSQPIASNSKLRRRRSTAPMQTPNLVLDRISSTQQHQTCARTDANTVKDIPNSQPVLSSTSNDVCTDANDKHKPDNLISLSQKPQTRRRRGKSDARSIDEPSYTYSILSSSSSDESDSCKSKSQSSILEIPDVTSNKSEKKQKRRSVSKRDKSNSKTSARKTRVEYEGFCPLCQMPFSLLVIETPTWHISDCMQCPMKTEAECPDGLQCDSTISSHYKKFHHSVLAKSRAGNNPHQSVLSARTKLDFDDQTVTHKPPAQKSSLDFYLPLSSSDDSGAAQKDVAEMLSVALETDRESDSRPSVTDLDINVSTETVSATHESLDMLQKRRLGQELAHDLDKQQLSPDKSEEKTRDDDSDSDFEFEYYVTPPTPIISNKDHFQKKSALPSIQIQFQDRQSIDEPSESLLTRKENEGSGASQVQSSEIIINLETASPTECGEDTVLYSQGKPDSPTECGEDTVPCSRGKPVAGCDTTTPRTNRVRQNIKKNKLSNRKPVKVEDCPCNKITNFFTFVETKASVLKSKACENEVIDLQTKDSGATVKQELFSADGSTESSQDTLCTEKSACETQQSITDIKCSLNSQLSNMNENSSGEIKRIINKSMNDVLMSKGRQPEKTSAKFVAVNPPPQSQPPSQGGRSWKRKCPFYKKIPGTPFTVDAFSYGDIEGCQGYFLSHFHYDHYNGLRKSFRHAIYCSKITGNLVKRKINVDESVIHTLPMDTPCMVNGVEITLLEANHCPGSVLILFKLPNGAVHLHTGDFRASQSMETYPALLNVSVDQLYLDTTYCDSSYAFPPQQAVINFAVNLAVKAVDQNPKTLIVCGTYTIGKERIFIAIAEALNCKVCVARDKKVILDCLEDKRLTDMISLKYDQSQVHVLPMGKLRPSSLEEHLSKHTASYNNLLAFEPTGWTFSNKMVSLDQIRPKYNKYGIKIYGVPYSEHSSFLEMKRFVQFVKPKQILPTVNNGNPQSRKKMEAIFKDWLHEKPTSTEKKQSSLTTWMNY